MSKSPIELNSQLNLWTSDHKINFEADKEAVRAYFLEDVNQNTVFFHSLSEKLEYLFDNDYYDKAVFDQYAFEDVKKLYQQAYAHKFRFPTFMGAFKYYTGYTLKTFDGKRFLERYEDRVVAVALTLARGDVGFASTLVDEIILGRFQPATPTFLSAGKAQRGELVSCFLVDIQDNMESIGRAVNSSLQLSKRGGGVALNLTNLREDGAPIKKIEGQASGIVPVMKILETSFKYANQLGQRQGAGAVYLNVHHPDIMAFLDTKRENADELVRIKQLSLGVIVPNITFELAAKGEPMYLFSPYDVEKFYGKSFSMVNVSDEYYNMVDNAEIKKYKINPRTLFQTIAKIQMESGYPYIMFEDAANQANPIDGRVQMSNLCSEILQVQTPSLYNEDGSYKVIGNDISCNLGSLNIAKAMDGGNLGLTVDIATRALSAVADMTSMDSVPSIRKANAEGHAIGLGQMNLHGFLAREGIHYGSEEALDFVNVYFALVNFYSLLSSNGIAVRQGKSFAGFENSKYADGSYFDEYLPEEGYFGPKVQRIAELFEKFGIYIPNAEEWQDLKGLVMQNGLYNMYRLAIPPTGSISYINNSTSSIHPIAAQIELRKEGKTGRICYPAPYLTNENREFFQDAYEIGYAKLIDTYAAATPHVDQGLSLTLFMKEMVTNPDGSQRKLSTDDLFKAYKRALKKGIKTLYYIRIQQVTLAGTEAEECVSCSL